MTRATLIAIVTAAVLLLPATAHAWKLVGAEATTHESRRGGFSVQLPAGWKYMKRSSSVTLSKDGPGLHSISVEKLRTRRAFKGLEDDDRDASPDMLPEELAEAYLADIRVRSGLETIEVVSEEPFIVGDDIGFRMELEYTDANGLRKREINIAFVHGADQLYKIVYAAPDLHYFQRDLPVFEAVLESFTLTD